MQHVRTAIIIGASSGIGEALAREMIQRGYRVGLTARRLELLQQIQNQAPDRVTVQKMDVTELDAARSGLQSLFEKYDRVDYIYINAGVITHSDQWQEQKQLLDVNVTGFTGMANQALELFKQQGHGHLVGISSISALRGVPQMPVYSGSKAYVSNYLEGMRLRIAREYKHIHITDIQPGYVQTAIIDHIKKTIFVATAQKAARQIVNAAERKKKIARITRRWSLVGFFIKRVPDFIYSRFV